MPITPQDHEDLRKGIKDSIRRFAEQISAELREDTTIDVTRDEDEPSRIFIRISTRDYALAAALLRVNEDTMTDPMLDVPDYSRNDPKGWGGDPKRGAALGRCNIPGDPGFSGTLYVRHVELAGDYDVNGTYWGSGDPIYWVADLDLSIEMTFRDRARDPLLIAHKFYPNAKLVMSIPVTVPEDEEYEDPEDQ